MGKYFTIKELCNSNTANKLGIKNIPNKEEENNLELLIEKILDPIRESFGNPIQVTSGFRCEELNKKTGGVKTSEHRLGMAADITCSNNKKLWEEIIRLHKIGIINFGQLINEKNLTWIHISYNKNRLRNQILKLD